MSNRLLAGRYELMERIGEGGMAVVYKAKCRLLNRYVAIKILRPEFVKDSQFLESFKRESQATASLSHPNIVSVYDVGKEGNINYIVMELIDGRPLSEIIKEEAPMDYRKAIEITKQVAAALNMAHKNHLIHRDVKPHNILITKDGIAKLTDFGIAKAVSDATLVSGTNRVIGSVHYFSPEQARGNYVDERSDIYSLGIVLYEMLTGRVPFDGDNPVSVALMHINEQITPPSKLVTGIPPALEKLVLKATDKFQTNRYSSAQELLEELDNIEFVTKVVGNSVFAAEDRPKYNENPIEDLEALTGKKHTKKISNPVEKKKISKSNEGMYDKNKKLLMFSGIGIGVILLLVGILYFTGIFGNSDEITVPSLLNMTYEEAKEKLEELNLEISKGDEVDSADVEKGKITSQLPSADSKVKEGKTIIVNISKGKTEGVIPNLISMKLDGLSEYIEGFGFKIGYVTKEESDVPSGTVIDQSPAGGEKREPGTTIDITVSKEVSVKEGVVPVLTGLTVDEARNEILNAGFKIGDISSEESNVYEKDFVMWQQYGPNTKLEEGSTIDIKVSKGKEDEIEPEIPPEGGEEDSELSDDI